MSILDKLGGLFSKGSKKSGIELINTVGALSKALSRFEGLKVITRAKVNGNAYTVDEAHVDVIPWKQQVRATAEIAPSGGPPVRKSLTIELIRDWRRSADDKVLLDGIPQESADVDLTLSWHGSRVDAIYRGEFLANGALQRIELIASQDYLGAILQ